MALRSIPSTLQALADPHPGFLMLAVSRFATQASSTGQTKKERRQLEIDDQLAPAVHKSKHDGSHSLYKVIRRFPAGKPQERVQLRDSQGRFSHCPRGQDLSRARS